MNMLWKADAINSAIDTKVQTAQLCKDIIKALVNPTKELTLKLIQLKELYPDKYREVEPMLKDFLWWNQENIDVIGQYLINRVLHIGTDIEHFQNTSPSSDDVSLVPAKAAITHIGNSIFDASRHDFVADKELVFAIADAINKKGWSSDSYQKVKPYTSEDIEFTYKDSLVRLKISNIMQQIGKQKKGNLGKSKEWYLAFLEALASYGYQPIVIEKQSHDLSEKQLPAAIAAALLPIEQSRLPLMIKNDKPKLYAFLAGLRSTLSDKVTSQHFVNIKPTNPDIAQLELSITVENIIIKNTVFNIYNALSKLFFGKIGNFAPTHQLLVDLTKMDLETFRTTYPLMQEIEQDKSVKAPASAKETMQTQKEFISTLDLQQAYMAIVEKHSGRQNLDQFFEHYNLKEDQSAIKKLQNYKVILRQFITELQKFTKNQELIDEARAAIKIITDKELRAAHNYIKEYKHAGPIQIIVDIVKKYNDRK